MEILGIGPLELLLILAIALIVLGPNDMVKAGRTIGRFLRRIVTSPEWRTVQQASKDIRYLPNRLMREAGLEEELNKMKEISSHEELKGLSSDLEEWRKDISSWTTPPPTIGTPSDPLTAGDSKPAAPDGAAGTRSSAQDTQEIPPEEPEKSESG